MDNPNITTPHLTYRNTNGEHFIMLPELDVSIILTDDGQVGVGLYSEADPTVVATRHPNRAATRPRDEYVIVAIRPTSKDSA